MKHQENLVLKFDHMTDFFKKGGQGPQNFQQKFFHKNVGNCMKHQDNKIPKIYHTRENLCHFHDLGAEACL